MAVSGRQRVGMYRRWLPAIVVGALLVVMTGMLAGSGTDSARAERVLRAGMVISFDGGISPNVLPRHRPKPIRAHLSGHVRAIDGGRLPRLERLKIEINRNAIVSTRGLPVCWPSQVRDSLAEEALANCREALVGGGTFGVKIALPDQKVTEAKGRAFAFNSRIGERRAVLMHIVTSDPVAVAITLPLIMHRQKRGDYGLRLISPRLSRLVNHYVFTTDFSFTLGRVYKTKEGRQSYLSAACRAPRGFNGGIFSLARATYEFRDGRRVRQSLIRNCRVAGG